MCAGCGRWPQFSDESALEVCIHVMCYTNRRLYFTFYFTSIPCPSATTNVRTVVVVWRWSSTNRASGPPHHHHHHYAKRSAVASPRRCDLSPKRYVFCQLQSIGHQYYRVPAGLMNPGGGRSTSSTAQATVHSLHISLLVA